MDLNLTAAMKEVEPSGVPYTLVGKVEAVKKLVEVHDSYSGRKVHQNHYALIRVERLLLVFLHQLFEHSDGNSVEDLREIGLFVSKKMQEYGERGLQLAAILFPGTTYFSGTYSFLEKYQTLCFLVGKIDE
jgi:hypothetical protein